MNSAIEARPGANARVWSPHKMLYEFVTQHRAEIIARTRSQVELRSNSIVTEKELTYGVPPETCTDITIDEFRTLNRDGRIGIAYWFRNCCTK